MQTVQKTDTKPTATGENEAVSKQAWKEGNHVQWAIAQVRGALAKDGIAKNKKSTQGATFMYRGIDDVYGALATLLAEQHLNILPRFKSRDVQERMSKAGGVLFYVTMEVEYDFVSALDGSMYTARVYGEAMDSGDKGTNKAMSAAFKYMALQCFSIPVEGEPDADETTHSVQAPTAQAAQPGNTLPARPAFPNDNDRRLFHTNTCAAIDRCLTIGDLESLRGTNAKKFGEMRMGIDLDKTALSDIEFAYRVKAKKIKTDNPTVDSILGADGIPDAWGDGRE